MKTYQLTGDGELIVYANTGVRDFCEDVGMLLEEFNMHVTIDPSVTDCSEMFRECTEFNRHVVIPTGVKDCTAMFRACSYFNKEIVIPYGVTSCKDMFLRCGVFNHPVDIPETVEDCSGMFGSANGFDSPVTMHYGVKTCRNMFGGCEIFNQEIEIPSSVVDCSSMFVASGYTKKVKIPDSVENCDSMFWGCIGYREPIELPVNVKSCNDIIPGRDYRGVIIFPPLIRQYKADEAIYFGNENKELILVFLNPDIEFVPPYPEWEDEDHLLKGELFRSKDFAIFLPEGIKEDFLIYALKHYPHFARLGGRRLLRAFEDYTYNHLYGNFYTELQWLEEQDEIADYFEMHGDEPDYDDFDVPDDVFDIPDEQLPF